MSELLQLFPPSATRQSLQGLYLSRRHHEAGTPEKPFVYANFLSSLDGRIALHDDQSDTAYVPDGLTSPNDFRLFLELQAQADCLITHGGYCRDLAAGKLGNILQIGAQPGAEDLLAWRAEQGLSPQPDIVIASASLDFPMPEFLNNDAQKVIIATGKQADQERVDQWQEQGYSVIRSGQEKFTEGQALIQALGQSGYRSIYLVAGPRMLETMLQQQQLEILYLTHSHQFLGGDNFHTAIPGNSSGSYGKLELESLYLDADGKKTGQWFSQFRVCYE